jgi:iron complex outermembrane receptor protein
MGRQGQCVDDEALWLSGKGSRELKPETSVQQTLGLRFMPSASHSFSVDYWRISMRDTIRQYPFNLVLSDPLKNTQFFTLNSSDRLDLYLPMVNMGSSVKSGLDLSWIYRVPIDSGRIFFKFDTTHYLKSEQIIIPYSDASGTVTPRNLSRWTAVYQHAQGSISATLNHTSGYISDTFPALDQQTGKLTDITGMKVPAFWTLDLQTRYNWSSNITLKAAVGNILNRAAPMSFTQNTSTLIGINPNLSSTWGRTLSLGVTARF